MRFISPLPVLLFCLHALAVHAEFSVQIVTWGLTRTVGLGALPYMGPVMDTAIKNLQMEYRERINFKLTYVFDERLQTCLDLAENIDNMMAKWYYKRSHADLVVFIGAGCTDMVNMNRMATNWNILLITTLATSPILGNKEGPSPTWVTTTCFPQGAYVSIYTRIILKYNWTTPLIVVDADANIMYPSTAKALFMSLTREIGTPPLNIFTFPGSSGSFHGLLSYFRNVSRVLLFFGHGAPFRRLLVEALRKNMTNGEYVYIAFEAFRHKLFGKFDWEYNDDNDENAKTAYGSALVIGPATVDDRLIRNNDTGERRSQEKLKAEWKERAKNSLNYNYSFVEDEQPTDYQLGTYAAFASLAMVVNQTIGSENGFDFRNGKKFTNLFLNREFATDVGKIFIDKFGWRQVDLAVRHFNHESNSFQQFLFQPAESSNLELIELRNVSWTGDMGMPPNEPICGFQRNQGPCEIKIDRTWLYHGLFGFLGALGLIICIFSLVLIVVRKIALRARLEDCWWKFNFEDITFSTQNVARLSQVKPRSHAGIVNGQENVWPAGLSSNCQISGRARYQLKGVWVKRLENPCKTPFDNTKLSKPDLKLLQLFNQLHDAAHDNLNKFIGVAILQLKETEVFLVSEFSSNGCLHHLFSSTIQVDSEFKSCFILDFLEGLQFIHVSTFGCHGYLSGWRCLIDKHFSLKIGTLGFAQIKSELGFVNEKCEKTNNANDRHLFWTAPEVLSKMKKPDKAADIYSAGVILYEIIYQQFPYEELSHLSKDEILHEVQAGNLNPMSFSVISREHLLHFTNPKFLDLCFDKDPTNRPNIRQLKEAVKKSSVSRFLASRKVMLIEKLVYRLQNLASDLEDIVDQRTSELLNERRKTDELLNEILPRVIQVQLRNGQYVHPEVFDSVSILFGGISGFVEFVAVSGTFAVIQTLNEIYTVFDSILANFDVYKVETVGNSYMVASGVPVRNGVSHAKQISLLSINLLPPIRKVLSEKHLSLKCGVHSGTCAAGVVGFRRPSFCLFGDTVNVASRLEGASEPDRILISITTVNILKQHYVGMFQIQARGQIPLKGRGNMEAFWLLE